MSPSTGRSLAIIHLMALSIYLYSIYYQEIVQFPFLPEHRIFGKFKFLTYWNLLLQFQFFLLLNINNFLKNKTLSKLIDILFYSWALPISLVVASIFWTLYAIDRDLIFPEKLDPYYPPWLNHSTHTLVAVFTLIELFWGQHRPPCNKVGLILLNLFLLSYNGWCLYIALFHGFWVYPFLEVMNWPQRIIFLIISGFINSLYYHFGVWCSKFSIQNKTHKKSY